MQKPWEKYYSDEAKNFDLANMGAQTIGALFDRVQDGVIADQRLLWIFPLIYLIIKGAGAISVDGLLGRRSN